MSICPHFLEKILNMPLNTHLNSNFISNSSLNLTFVDYIYILYLKFKLSNQEA
jgi:hypothetical protein